MRNLSNQLSLADIYEECVHLLEHEKPRFIQLLEQTIDFADFIPKSFYDDFYKHFGRKREYPLTGFISSCVLQKIYGIPSDILLIIFLVSSKELREFCGFDKVPDPSKFTRFKQTFAQNLFEMFSNLVDYTEPICQELDKVKASTLLYDTTGIEGYVTENNPKYTASLIRKLKAANKNNPHIDPYRLAYGLMPPHSAADKNIKQMHINGRFCYAHKATLITNALGIIRHVQFLDDEFKQNHNELVIEKRTDCPDEDKSIGDSTSLQPVLTDFFAHHPDFSYHTFLADSAFDKGGHYTFLKEHFKRVLIPINPRNTSDLPPVGYNEYGYPVCPNDPSLPMRLLGKTCEKGRSHRLKWRCPKVEIVKGTVSCSCPKPCSNAKFGRTSYTFEGQDFRMLPGIVRDSDEWIKTFKLRPIIEQTINHFKINMCVAERKTRNLPSTKADFLLAGIAQLFSVVVACRMKKPELFRSLKRLIA